MKRTAPARRTRLRPRSRQLIRDKALDDLCRTYVRLRDEKCQRCGTPGGQWSHVVTRGAKSCRWAWWNSKLLCGGCHRWWASHPLGAAAWFQAKWPDRYVAWQAWRHDRKRPPINRPLIKTWLQGEIRKLVGDPLPQKGP